MVMRRLVESGMFPGTFSSYDVLSFPELLLLPRICDTTPTAESTGLPETEKQAEDIIPCLGIFGRRDTEYLIIYAHGNGSDIGDIYQRLKELSTHLHAHILAFDYPGYGMCKGRADEKIVDQCIRAVYYFAIHELQWPKCRIFLWGCSIGTGPAARLARELSSNQESGNHTIGGLILQCPYRSITHAAKPFIGEFLARWIVRPHWNVEEDTINCTCPILWIHGQQDTMFFWGGSLDMYELYRRKHGDKAQGHFPVDATHFEFGLFEDIIKPTKKLIMISKESYKPEWNMTVNKVQEVRIEYAMEKFGPRVCDFWTLADVNQRSSAQRYPSQPNWSRYPKIGRTGAASIMGKDLDMLDIHLPQVNESSTKTPGSGSKSSNQLLKMFGNPDQLHNFLANRIIQFMNLLQRLIHTRNVLHQPQMVRIQDLLHWVQRCFVAFCSGLSVDALLVYDGKNKFWKLDSFIFGGLKIRLRNDETQRGDIELSYVAPGKMSTNVLHLRLPIFVSHIPNFQCLARWLLESLRSEPTVSDVAISEHLSWSIIQALYVSRRPAMECLAHDVGDLEPYGWDIFMWKIFKHNFKWFAPRLLFDGTMTNKPPIRQVPRELLRRAIYRANWKPSGNELLIDIDINRDQATRKDNNRNISENPSGCFYQPAYKFSCIEFGTIICHAIEGWRIRRGLSPIAIPGGRNIRGFDNAPAALIDRICRYLDACNAISGRLYLHAIPECAEEDMLVYIEDVLSKNIAMVSFGVENAINEESDYVPDPPSRRLFNRFHRRIHTNEQDRLNLLQGDADRSPSMNAISCSNESLSSLKKHTTAPTDESLGSQIESSNTGTFWSSKIEDVPEESKKTYVPSAQARQQLTTYSLLIAGLRLTLQLRKNRLCETYRENSHGYFQPATECGNMHAAGGATRILIEELLCLLTSRLSDIDFVGGSTGQGTSMNSMIGRQHCNASAVNKSPGKISEPKKYRPLPNGERAGGHNRMVATMASANEDILEVEGKTCVNRYNKYVPLLRIERPWAADQPSDGRGITQRNSIGPQKGVSWAFTTHRGPS